MRLSAEQIAARADAARALLSPCRVCPRRCGADRLAGEAGDCRIGRDAVVASFGGHFGEEPEVSGRRGSGTVFLSGCNLACRFCQNHDVSWACRGLAASAEDLATIFLSLEAEGRHNVNLVSPTHVTPQLLEALALARGRGLSVPILWNSGGYEEVSTLELLDGVVDVYMPDLKYADAAVGARWSGVPDYPEVARAAIGQMHRQVGDLALDADGVATRGLLVRHLVLPEGLAGTAALMRFLADELSVDTFVNVMAQYRPRHLVHDEPPLDRPVTPAEWREAVAMARAAGLSRLARDPPLRPS